MPRESVVFTYYFVVLILLFSVKNFCNSGVGHECFLNVVLLNWYQKGAL